MRLLFWRKRSRPSEGQAARERAEVELRATKEKTAEVRDLAMSMRRIREENHFAEQIAALVRGGH